MAKIRHYHGFHYIRYVVNGLNYSLCALFRSKQF